VNVNLANFFSPPSVGAALDVARSDTARKYVDGHHHRGRVEEDGQLVAFRDAAAPLTTHPRSSGRAACPLRRSSRHHHAADDTMPLLKEARRVVKPDGRVVVVEDLRADDAAGLRHQDSEHKGCPRRCVFRTDNEWRAIFRRLGLRVESTAAPPRDCIPHYQVDRALYVIT
jgi:SAM-dependent methyltransferase